MLAIATHLYVRLRKTGNRVIDVIWMQRSPEYAREVLKVARGIADAEIQALADRLEELITGVPRPRITAPAAATVLPFSPEVASRYRGALR
jgi:hypothetical protein